MWFNPYGWRLGAPNACSAQALETASGRGEEGLGEFLSACPKGTQAEEARRRLDTQIDIREAMLVSDAGFDAGKLRVYLQTCTRCSSRSDAEGRLSLMRDEEAIYRAAAGSIESRTTGRRGTRGQPSTTTAAASAPSRPAAIRIV